MNYVTHPVFDSEYDCRRHEIFDGEKRWHQKGDKDDCPTCERYRANFTD